MSPFEIKWSAPEFDFRPKGVSWYWVSIIVAIVVLGASVWQKNFLFGFFVVAAEILVLVWANREPQSVEFILNERGVAVGSEKFYAYSGMESWSAEADVDREWPALYFQFRRRLKPALKIKMSKERVAEIQKALGQVLRKTEHEPSFLDTLEELIGF